MFVHSPASPGTESTLIQALKTLNTSLTQKIDLLPDTVGFRIHPPTPPGTAIRAAYFREPFFDAYARTQKASLENIKNGILEGGWKLIDLLDDQGAKLLQFQSRYIASGKSDTIVFDSILILERRLAKTRRKIEDILHGPEMDRLHVSLDTHDLQNIPFAQLESKLIVAVTTGKQILQQIMETTSHQIKLAVDIKKRTEIWTKGEGAGISKPEAQETVAGLPQLLQTESFVSPSVTMVAGVRSDSSWYHELGLFTATSKDIGKQALQSVFNPDQSNLGMFLRGSYTRIKLIRSDVNDRFAIHYQIYYLNKSVHIDTLTDRAGLDFNQIQGRLASELIVFDNLFSIYGGISFNTPITNLETFRNDLPLNSTGQVFGDVGFRLFFEPGSSKVNVKDGFGFIVDVNFMINNKDMRDVNPTKDSIVPALRVAMQKSLSSARK